MIVNSARFFVGHIYIFLLSVFAFVQFDRTLLIYLVLLMEWIQIWTNSKMKQFSADSVLKLKVKYKDPALRLLALT